MEGKCNFCSSGFGMNLSCPVHGPKAEPKTITAVLGCGAVTVSAGNLAARESDKELLDWLDHHDWRATASALVRYYSEFGSIREALRAQMRRCKESL